MAEKKLPRLLQAAKEFNVGQDTLIDFLVAKGFEKDDLKPSSKLSEAMYTALQQGFHSDKAAKNISDQVELPKGLGGDNRRRRDDEEQPPIKKEEPVVPVAEPVKTEEPAAVVEEAPPVEEKEIRPEPAPEPEAEKTQAPTEEPVAKVQVPDIEGPKIISKIDLSAIDSSTRPKRPSKKEQAPAEEKQPE